MIVPLTTPIKPTLFHAQFWSSSKPAYVLKALGLTGNADGGGGGGGGGATLSLVSITAEQLKADPVLVKLNPQKRLPFFYDPEKDLKLNESSGMIEYLLETYDKDNKLWPAPGEPTRAEYLKLLHFGPATGYHVGVPILFHFMPPEGSEATPVKVLEAKKREFHQVVAPTYEHALEKYGGPFLLGEKFTAADIVSGYDLMTIGFAGCGKEMLEAHPKVKAYLEHIGQCPIYKELYCPPASN